jgi:hypothetical protein
MPVKACYPTPLLHVAEIERAMKFYDCAASKRSTPTAASRSAGRACLLTAAR